MITPATIGIDLGGTNIKTALIDANGSPLSRRVSQYDPAIGPDATVELIAAAVDEMRSELRDAVRLVGAGIGCPGPMDRAAGRVINAANLPGWHDVPIRDLLSRRLELPVVFDNDGNAAAFGESLAAAKQGDADAQYMVGFLYMRGQGTRRDSLRAYQWFSLAARQGDSYAADELEGLAARMSPARISQAEAWVREWTPTAVD